MATSEQNDLQLDAEYRALVRSLHVDTIATVVEVQRWLKPDAMRMATLGGYKKDEEQLAKDLEASWRNQVEPRLLTLAQGHPDPDVRFAADILDKRLWSLIIVMGDPQDSRRLTRSHDEISVTVHLVDDGLVRLRRAAYHAPFRVSRPELDFDGYSTATREPLPGKMLETIEELQRAGVLPERGNSFLDRSLADAVTLMSDIVFMSAADREKYFADKDVEDPTLPDVVDTATTERIKFGFALSEQTSPED